MFDLSNAVRMLETTGSCAGPVKDKITNWGQHSDQLPPGQQSRIDQFADLIVSSFDQSKFPPFREVQIIGHADKDWRGAEFEGKVSFKRAETVEKALTAAVKRIWDERGMGPPPTGGVQWEVQGKGSKQMIAAPYQPANRRVEITLVGSGPLVKPPKPPRKPTVFTPGVIHNHQPSGKWHEVQKNPNSPGASPLLLLACKRMSPQDLVKTAIVQEFMDKPIALEHLNWYLRNGRGRDFVEDKLIELMLEQDNGVRTQIAARIPSNQTTGTLAKHIKLEQTHYTSQDFRFAFGAIDRLDFEVDFDDQTIHVWFQDRYEWHPFYPNLYPSMTGDVARETNCVHAALVELKTAGAADFWMKGEATVPLKTVLGR